MGEDQRTAAFLSAPATETQSTNDTQQVEISLDGKDTISMTSSALPTPTSGGEGERLENEDERDEVVSEDSVASVGSSTEGKAKREENSTGQNGVVSSTEPRLTKSALLGNKNTTREEEISPEPLSGSALQPNLLTNQQEQVQRPPNISSNSPNPPAPVPSYFLPDPNPQGQPPPQHPLLPQPPLQLYNQRVPSSQAPLRLYKDSSRNPSLYSSIGRSQSTHASFPTPAGIPVTIYPSPQGYVQNPNAMDLPGVPQNPRNDSYFKTSPYIDGYESNQVSPEEAISTAGPNRGGDVGLVAGLMYLWEKGWEKGAGLLGEIWDGDEEPVSTRRRG